MSINIYSIYSTSFHHFISRIPSHALYQWPMTFPSFSSLSVQVQVQIQVIQVAQKKAMTPQEYSRPSRSSAVDSTDGASAAEAWQIKPIRKWVEKRTQRRYIIAKTWVSSMYVCVYIYIYTYIHIYIYTYIHIYIYTYISVTLDLNILKQS